MSNADVTEGVAKILLTETPSLDDAQALLRRNGLSRQEATGLIYESVRKISNEVFFPLSQLELLLAEGCDMACTYCFESAILDPALKRHRVMSDDVIERAVGLLFDYAAPESRVGVTLFGGEPTLNFRGIKTAVGLTEKRAREGGHAHYFNMTTNGLHMTGEMIEYFAEHSVRVLLSIDGGRATHDLYRKDRRGRGTFDRILANLAALKKVQPWIGAKLTVMPSEAAHLFESVQTLRGHGVNQFIIGAASGVDWQPQQTAAFIENWQRLGEWMRTEQPEDVRISDFEEDEVWQGGPRFGCGGGRSTIAVNVAGEISGCSKIISLESDRTVGKLGDVWHGMYMVRTRMDMAGCAKLIDNCTRAGIADSYRGGCFATNFAATGDMYIPNLKDHAMNGAKSAVVEAHVISK